MWFPLTLLTALIVGCSDALVKKGLQTNRVQTLSWVRPGWAVVVLLPFFPWMKGPSNPWSFWHPVLIAIPLEVCASLMFHSALQSSAISNTIPYMAFTPVFVLLTGRIFLGEKVSFQGMVGVGLITVGAFVLQAPLKSFHREKGPLLVLGVALIYSFTAALAKKAMLASSPLYFCTVYYFAIAAALIPFQMGSSGWAQQLISQPKLFLMIGVLEAAGLFFQFTAFQYGPVAYVIAIKRISLLVSVFLGWKFFQERHMAARMAGAAFMALGSILICLS